jgi:hypothetical protein
MINFKRGLFEQITHKTLMNRRKTLARDVESDSDRAKQVRVEMPGDGNCLFRAVAFALRGTQQAAHANSCGRLSII